MGKGGEDDRETLTKWRDEDNKESVTQSEQWPQRGAGGVLGARGVTQVRDGLHQDCCLMVQGLDCRSVSALSQSVRVGFNACVCVCVSALWLSV